MSLRFALSAVGAAAGFILGGPGGARWGFMIGSTIGSVVDPGTVKGPSIGDIAQQTAQEGVPRPIVFGISQPITGNIIAQSEPEIVRNRSGGKGGPSYVTESVYRTYAIRVCEGPISAFRRIWRNNVLVYDATEDPQLTTEDNLAFLETARLFTGAWDQDVSPDLEAIWGVGTTPTYRGTCYMVMADEDLTELRGAIPQWTFQVSNGALAELLSTDVLYPWDATNPLNPENFHRFRFHLHAATVGPPDSSDQNGTWFGGDTYNTGLSLAVNEGDSASWVSGTPGEYAFGPMGWSRDWQQMYPVHSATPGELVSLQFHYNKIVPEYFQGVTAAGPGGLTYCNFNWNFVPPLLTAELGRFDWWSPRPSGESAGPGNSAVWGRLSELPGPTAGNNCVASTVIGGGFHGHPDAHITVQRVPRKPPGNWTAVTGTFKALQAYSEGLVVTELLVLTYPLNPTIEVGSDDDTQAFWESAYADAVANGDMESGLTYGVDYPAEITEAWLGYGIALTSRTSVPAIIAAASERAGVPSSLLNLSELVGLETYGITITNQYPVVEAFRSLGQVYCFDISPRDGKLAFPIRGASSVATITEDDLVDDDNDITEADRRMDPITVPRVMHLNYFDIAGGLATDKQTSTRAGDFRSIGEASIQSPVIMDADEAARVVVINHKVLAENQKGTRKFSLGDNWLRLCTANAIIVPVGGVNRRMRVEKLDILDGMQTLECAFDRQSAYTSNVEGIPSAPQTPPPTSLVGPTLILPLDIPLLRDGDDPFGIAYYVAVAGVSPAWRGALVELSMDGGANYIDSQTATVSAVIGELVTELPDHPQSFPDETNIFTVRILTPEADLQSSDLAGMLNRANLAVIGDPEYGDAQPLELINFATVAETSAEGDWDVSYLLRGRKDTPTRHHTAGEAFVLLERSVLGFIVGSVADLGRTLTFRATSLGSPTDTGTVISILFRGATQIERHAGYLAAHRDGTDAVVTWQGVARLGGGASVAHGLHFAGYRVVFDDGTNPAVTVDTALETITQDVSGLSSPITISLYQLNNLTGEGPAVEVILT